MKIPLKIVLLLLVLSVCSQGHRLCYYSLTADVLKELRSNQNAIATMDDFIHAMNVLKNSGTQTPVEVLQRIARSHYGLALGLNVNQLRQILEEMPNQKESIGANSVLAATSKVMGESLGELTRKNWDPVKKFLEAKTSSQAFPAVNHAMCTRYQDQAKQISSAIDFIQFVRDAAKEGPSANVIGMVALSRSNFALAVGLTPEKTNALFASLPSSGSINGDQILKAFWDSTGRALYEEDFTQWEPVKLYLQRLANKP